MDAPNPLAKVCQIFTTTRAKLAAGAWLRFVEREAFLRDFRAAMMSNSKEEARPLVAGAPLVLDLDNYGNNHWLATVFIANP